MVKWEVKLFIVVIQYKFVCQPVWENINKAVKIKLGQEQRETESATVAQIAG